MSEERWSSLEEGKPHRAQEQATGADKQKHNFL